MPPNNGQASQQATNARRRNTADRVLPAIPLALSKPRPSKSAAAKPKPAVNGSAENEHVTNGQHHTPLEAAVQEEGDGDALSRAATLIPNGEDGVATRLPEAAVDGLKPASDVVKKQDQQQLVATPDSSGSAAMSLSTGATPELPSTESTRSTRPSTPPVASQPSTTTSPTSSRKPFDMRNIRTELPPAFVPSSEQYTPRSAASASSHSNRPFLPNAHQSHPSTNSIVFGGQDSSNPSPAPPLSGGSGFAPPPFSAAAGNPQPYHFAVPGHAYHSSEPYGQRMFQPGYQNNTSQWNPRASHGHPAPAPPFHHHAHMPFRYPPREVFTPVEPQSNGHISRDGSQHSSGAADHQQQQQPSLRSPLGPNGTHDPMSAALHDHRPSLSRPIHARPPVPFTSPDFNNDYENAEALRRHVLAQSSNEEFVDCVLEISDDCGSDGTQLNAHRIILTRSPTMANLVQMAQRSTSHAGPLTVRVQLQGRYARVGALLNAVKYLYGGPALSVEPSTPAQPSGEQTSPNVERMDRALQNIAVGAWLKVLPLAQKAEETVNRLLHWDTLSSALSFALDGGLSNIWTIEDGSEDPVSSSSSDDSLGKPEQTGTPTYDPHSTLLLQRILDFTVHMFPPNFYLDAAAPQLECCPRLPSIPKGHESRPSRADPRLTQIRFGEVPAEDLQRPSFATTTISSVLLSLPFVLLKFVLEHFDLASRLGPDTVASIMRQVVAEREVRRTKTLKARVAGQLDPHVDELLVHNLYWSESVELSAHHRAGSRLVRRKVDIDTPPSSGACSEANNK